MARQRGGTRYVPPPDTWVEDDGSEATLRGCQCRDLLRPHNLERMKPFPDKAKEGRINPKGIPCLYTATDPRTAMSEVKPAIGSYLTLAEFVTEKELMLVNFATNYTVIADPFDLTEEEEDALCWEDMNKWFSEPVTDSDNVADYAPTQIVSELFRQAGYDGIQFESNSMKFHSLQPIGSPERLEEMRGATSEIGLNIALFDLTAASFKSSKLYQFKIVESGQFDFAPVRSSVFCSEQLPEQISEIVASKAHSQPLPGDPTKI